MVSKTDPIIITGDMAKSIFFVYSASYGQILEALVHL